MASYTPSASYTPAGAMTTSSYGGVPVGTTTSATSYISTTTYGGSIQSALQGGKLYHPTGTVYVAPGSALKAGMHTPYDYMTVPTFEAPLTFHAAGSRPMDVVAREVSDEPSYRTPLPMKKDKGCCAC